MIRISTINVNGVRAAVRKGMGGWLETADSAIITLQEVRATCEIAADTLAQSGYFVATIEAEAKGRAGVSIMSRMQPVDVRVGVGDDYFDTSGRWLEADFRLDTGGIFSVVSAYIHSGEVGTPKQDDKYRFLAAMRSRLQELRASSEHALVTGDFNIGHTELDIKNWKGNLKNAGFLPEERAFLDACTGDLGWVDVHRQLSGQVPGPYTWWSMRGQAFDNDTGWRIDYQLATPELAAAALSARVDKAASWGERWSDHAPLVIDYDIALAD